MAPETIFEHLGTVLQAENVASEPSALRLLARAARGSMRDALSLTDQAIAFGGGHLQEEAVRQMLGAVGRNHVFALIGALAGADGATVVTTIDGLRKQGLSAASTLEEMTHILQRMAVAQLTHAEPDPADPEAREVQRLAELLPADQTQLLYSLCLHGRTELGLAPDEYAALVMVLLRLLAFQPAGQRALAEKKSLTPPVERVVPQVRPVQAPPAPLQPLPVRQQPVAVDAVPVVDVPRRAEAHEVFNSNGALALDGIGVVATKVVSIPVRSAPEPVRPDLTPPAARAAPVAATADGDAWHALVLDMVQAETVGALVRELALQSQLVARDDTAQPAHWLLRVENATLNQPGTRDRLQAAIAHHGHVVKLTVEVGTVADTPARRQAAAAAQRQEEAERSIRQDPFVQALVRDFGGRIVPGTLRPLTPST